MRRELEESSLFLSIFPIDLAFLVADGSEDFARNFCFSKILPKSRTFRPIQSLKEFTQNLKEAGGIWINTSNTLMVRIFIVAGYIVSSWTGPQYLK